MSLSESAISGASARSHLKDAIGTLASHVGKANGIELSQQSIAAIQASAVNFTRNLTADIEMFARHRGARTVSTADLKMALRKSEALTNSAHDAEAEFADNMMNPQFQKGAVAEGNRKRGRPPKNAAANPVEFPASTAVVGSSPAAVSAFAQSADDNVDLLPQDSILAPPPPKFKSPRSRIVRSFPSSHATVLLLATMLTCATINLTNDGAG